MNLPDEYTTKLDSRVSSLEVGLQNLSSAVDRIATSVESLSSKVSSTSQTNWNVLGTWSAVLVSVMGGLGVLALWPIREGINDNREQLNTIQTVVYQHMQAGGHPAMEVKHAALKEDYEEVKQELKDQIQSLDATLQREMRDLDARQDIKIDNFDTVVQREVRQLDAIQDERFEGLRKQIVDLEQWTMHHDRSTRGSNEQQEVRLEHLEKGLHHHQDDANHPTGVLLEIERLRGEVKSLTEKVVRKQ